MRKVQCTASGCPGDSIRGYSRSILDLLNIFKEVGDVPDKKYLFFGDYVDMGYNGVEKLKFLLCLKLRYQGRITLLRGNHESR